MQYLILVGFVARTSRSRDHICPNYVLLGRKLSCLYSYNHENIGESDSNNSLGCCHELRIGKQNVHANKV